MSSNVSIAVIDDHPLFRHGVVDTLSAREEFTVIAQGASAEDAIRIARESGPDVMLLDVNMAGGGFTALKTIVADHPSVQCMILTVETDAHTVRSAMRIGAVGYVAKGVGGDELAETVRMVASGQRYVSPSLAAQLFSEDDEEDGADRRQEAMALERRPALTTRERQILAFVSRGLSNKEIGSSLSISDKTVKHHLSGVLQKLNVRNRVEAAVLGRARGFGSAFPLTRVLQGRELNASEYASAAAGGNAPADGPGFHRRSVRFARGGD
jgi:DNA-binding NarL/FixJ family response regulator